jgi:hypothetical protein
VLPSGGRRNNHATIVAKNRVNQYRVQGGPGQTLHTEIRQSPRSGFA